MLKPKSLEERIESAVPCEIILLAAGTYHCRPFCIPKGVLVKGTAPSETRLIFKESDLSGGRAAITGHGRCTDVSVELDHSQPNSH